MQASPCVGANSKVRSAHVFDVLEQIPAKQLPSPCPAKFVSQGRLMQLTFKALEAIPWSLLLLAQAYYPTSPAPSQFRQLMNLTGRSAVGRAFGWGPSDQRLVAPQEDVRCAFHISTCETNVPLNMTTKVTSHSRQTKSQDIKLTEISRQYERQEQSRA